MFLLGAILAAAACSDSGAMAVEEYAPTSDQARIVAAALVPEHVVLPRGTSADFTVNFSDAQGNPVEGPVLWSATGGSINRNGSTGRYVAGDEVGDFQVIARAPVTGVTDTAQVTITSDAGQDGDSDGDSGSEEDSGDDGSDSGDDGSDSGDDGSDSGDDGSDSGDDGSDSGDDGSDSGDDGSDSGDDGSDSGDDGSDSGTGDPSHLNFYSGFETGDLGEWNQTELCCSYSAQVVNTVAREGTRSVRLELHRDERKAELRNVPWKSGYGFAGRLNGPEMWYGVSIYVPDWYVPTSRDYQLVWQVHVPPGDGQKWQRPHFAAWLNAKGWSYTSRSGVDGSQQQKQFNVGSVRTNAWTDFVVRAVWRNDSNGILQIWMNGHLVVDESGPNTYGDRTRDYYNAVDFYRAGSSWPAEPGERDLYFDAVRVYEGTNGYDAVAPR